MSQTLEQRAGELFIVGFHGTVPSAEIKEMIRRYHVSGVILFARNIEDAAQLARLTDALQAEAKAAGYTAPLLIALDQENGVIRRIEKGVSLLPGAMALAATGDPTNAAKAYAASAAGLSALGVNWSLAPDADVNTNPDNPVIGVRSFGDQAPVVAQYVTQAVHGLQGNGMAACLKHFPGHGNTAVDSHQALPELLQSMNDLEETELIPFKAGIAAGAAAVMIAHIQFPAVDPTLPASLSPAVITTLLRDRLRFDGVIVTDDLEMKAIADHYGTPAACVRALQSGADLAMVSHVYATQKAAIAQVMAAMTAGTLTKAQTAKAARRLRKLRQRVGRWQTHFDAAAFASRVAVDAKLATTLYQRSVTLVQPAAHPLTTAPVVITFANQQQSLVVDHAVPINALVQSVRRVFPAAGAVTLDLADPAALTQLDSIPAGRPVVIGTSNVKATADIQAQAVRTLEAQGHAVHVIALRNPYDRRWLPVVASYTAAYEATPAALDQAVLALAGKGKPSGRLPVVLP
ncbi:beta-N-acetylhexosaminidase [Lacticaseibacillus jixianensis]|uniref:Beta-N-acetylhexosaminidase n=1 Tax=Lacticaseibacillus jixianensis TaxID=2486012 RepID=A0ABW4B5Y1_9LACO|nr:beta-N-acetylhexosaminidase [Lacticaseibacillus jixianensis]